MTFAVDSRGCVGEGIAIGWSSKSFTVSVNDFSKLRELESLVSNRTEYVDLVSKSGDSTILS